jgi:hypothetical protein
MCYNHSYGSAFQGCGKQHSDINKARCHAALAHDIPASGVVGLVHEYNSEGFMYLDGVFVP